MFFIFFVLLCPGQMDYRIKEIIAKVDNHISEPLTIPELAASVSVSVSHFQRLFKKELRICAVKYIRNRRLEKARELLETSHLRIKEIRVRVGATNEAHFMHGFKRKFGETPGNYRKNYLNDGNGQQIAQMDSKKFLFSEQRPFTIDHHYEIL